MLAVTQTLSKLGTELVANDAGSKTLHNTHAVTERNVRVEFNPCRVKQQQQQQQDKEFTFFNFKKTRFIILAIF